MAAMTDAERDAFLAPPRLGMFSTLTADGAPITVPVWFEWDGAAARIFSGAATGKVRRIERDPRASLLVANSIGEPEAWVAFDGDVAVINDGAIELAERLAHRYWDMNVATHRSELESWRAAAAHLRVLQLTPRRIRTSKG
jgi:PPOX class probable F420-dependent enzyme